ncbi:NCS2 family permease [candidate division KSB1 bacterium]|nr:MAG: NCS2 family permease [candidate division KSB1 bacterium]
MEFLNRFFHIKESGSNLKTETLGGLTTFFTLSYIFFVQPVILSSCGMDIGSVMVATCLSSALASFMMGIYANYPIALAPAMGHNFFFAITVCGTAAMGGLGYSWQTALGAVFIAGSIFLILSFWGLRERVMNALPDSLKNGIAVGIGLLITMLGLQWSGIVVDKPGILVGLGNLKSTPVLVSLFGIIFTAVLLSWKVRGAILIGIIVTSIIGIPFNIFTYNGILGSPPSIKPTFFKLDILHVFSNPDFLTVIFLFLFLDMFDTIGTLVGLSQQAGLMKNGKLPGARKALFSDAFGTVSGALLGTSTVTSYIESSAGITEGAKTGFANIVTGIMMLLTLFLYPFIEMIGGGYEISEGVKLYPSIAPTLIIVGSFMAKNIVNINWNDTTEAIPAFLSIIIMPMTLVITEGISFGIISYAVLKFLSGRAREVHPIMYILAVLFILKYIFISS